MLRGHHWAGAIARHVLPARERDRLRRVAIDDAGYGYDVFGAHRDWVAFGAAMFAPLYDRWFRVTSHGTENIPAEGGALLVANHSGALPLDATMIWLDVLRHTEPPRLVHAVLDHFVPAMPIVGTFFARGGSVGGSRGNVRHLLERGELVLVFPEGTRGVGKPFWERYRLQGWSVGHAELALLHRVPIVPVAVIGAEEQMPQLARIQRGARLFGAPYLPVVASPVPLPVHYHIWYGAPLRPAERLPPGSAEEPARVREVADEVKVAVEGLIARGLAERKGVFS